MIIKFSPVRADESKKIKSISLSGNDLHINEAVIDLSLLIDTRATDEEGNLLNELENEYILSCDSDFNLTVMLPHGIKAPESTRFPDDLIDVQDGEIQTPIYG